MHLLHTALMLGSKPIRILSQRESENVKESDWKIAEGFEEEAE